MTKAANDLKIPEEIQIGEIGKHRSPDITEVESGAMEELASVDRRCPLLALVLDQSNGVNRSQNHRAKKGFTVVGNASGSV
jgi:hypothetical protein